MDMRFSLGRRIIAAAAAVATVATFAGSPSGPPSALAGHAPPGTKLWAYEAALTNARILQYDIGTDTFDTSCVPQGVPTTSNGRGIAFDSRLASGAGGLWITRLTTFTGDGLIHKVGLPPSCPGLGSIPFGDGPGGAVPDDIGALDLDPDNGNLYAAEYISGLFGKDNISTLFEVDETSGAIIRACNLGTANGNGNDTLAVVKNGKGLPAGKYLVTDNGEFSTTAQFVIDVNSLGPYTPPSTAPACGIVATGNTPGGRTGIDFEPGTTDMIATGVLADAFIYDHNGFSWGTTQASMPSLPSDSLEDITLRDRALQADKEVTDLVLDDGSGYPDREGASLKLVSRDEATRTSRYRMVVEVSTNPIISVVSFDRNKGPEPTDTDITFLASIDDGHTPSHVEGAYIPDTGSPRGSGPDLLTCGSTFNPKNPLEQTLVKCPDEEKKLGDGIDSTAESDLHFQLFEKAKQQDRILRFFKLHCLVGGEHTITFYNKAEPKAPTVDPNLKNNWWRAVLELTCVTPGKVTGGGKIEPDGTITELASLLITSGPNSGHSATFGFVIEFQSGDPFPTGNLEYNDHDADVRIKAIDYATLVIVGCTAEFTGTASVNGTTEPMRVSVFDGGEPGSEPGAGPDTFEIDTATYDASGVLIGGNIQIHNGNPC